MPKFDKFSVSKPKLTKISFRSLIWAKNQFCKQHRCQKISSASPQIWRQSILQAPIFGFSGRTPQPKVKLSTLVYLGRWHHQVSDVWQSSSRTLQASWRSGRLVVISSSLQQKSKLLKSNYDEFIITFDWKTQRGVTDQQALNIAIFSQKLQKWNNYHKGQRRVWG